MYNSFGEEMLRKPNIFCAHNLDKNPLVIFVFKFEFLRANGIVPAQVGQKRPAAESPEPAIKEEDADSDDEEAKLLEEKLCAIREQQIAFYEKKLSAIREKRSIKAVKVKRVKTESKPLFISGEVIDLT